VQVGVGGWMMAVMVGMWLWVVVVVGMCVCVWGGVGWGASLLLGVILLRRADYVSAWDACCVAPHL
jgi:hypothetical protein